MVSVNNITLKSETQPARMRKKGVVTLVMLVWLVYWVGMFSQACCQPQLQSVHHHSSDMDDHDEHHDVVVAEHAHDTPADHENCPELTSADLILAPTVVLMGSASQPVLIASHNAIIPEQIFNNFFSYTISQQSHHPPNRFLRTRRLLI